MIQCNTIAIHSSSFVRSAARSFVHAPSPSPSARARASRLARRLTLMVGRSSPLRRDDCGGGRHNTPVRDARPRTREPVSHRTTSNKTPIVVPRRRRRRTVSRASRASEFNAGSDRARDGSTSTTTRNDDGSFYARRSVTHGLARSRARVSDGRVVTTAATIIASERRRPTDH